MLAGSLAYDTKLDTSGFQKGISSIMNSAKNGGSSIKSIVAGLGITKIITTAMNTIKGSIDGAISRVDTLNNFPKVMKTLGYSIEDADKSINKLSDGIDGLPTSLDEIVSNTQSLTASLGDLEKGTDSAIALNNMFLASGKGTEEAKRALTQYNQILAKGKVDQQAWNTLVEVAPGQMDQLAKSMLGANANQKDLYESLQNGSISVEELNNEIIRLNQEGGDNFSSFADQAKSATGGIATSIANIKTAIIKGLGNVIDAINEKLQSEGLPTIQEMLDKLKQAINDSFTKINDIIKNLNLSELISKLKELAPAIGLVGVALSSGIDFSSLLNAGSGIKLFSANFANSLEKTRKNVSDFYITTADKFDKMSDTFGKSNTKISSILGDFSKKISDLALETSVSLDDTGSKITSKIGNIVSQVGSIGGKLTKGIKIAAYASIIMAGLGLLQSNFGEQINIIIQTAITNGPKIIQGLITGILTQLPTLIEQGKNLIMSLLDVLIANLPTIIEGGLQIILALVTGIAQALPQLIPKIVEVLLLIVTSLLENIDLIIEAGIQLILGLALGLINALPQLIEKIPEIIAKLVVALTSPEMLIQLVAAAIQLILALAGGLIQAIPQLLMMVPKIISSLNKSFLEKIKNTDWKKLGKNILDGILKGILNVGSSVKKAAKKLVECIKDNVKSFFGIHSPSKLMENEVGKYIPPGIAVGIEANTKSALNAIDYMNDEILKKVDSAVALETGNINAKASLNSNYMYNSVIQINAKFDGVVDMDGSKVGRMVAPEVTKTIKIGGLR
ncbi:MAG: tape measure protein [Bacilli bacterium]|nr:tape measure protein [Bacilli bacterium]